MLVLIGMDFMRDPIPLIQQWRLLPKPPQGAGYWTRLRIEKLPLPNLGLEGPSNVIRSKVRKGSFLFIPPLKEGHKVNKRNVIMTAALTVVLTMIGALALGGCPGNSPSDPTPADTAALDAAIDAANTAKAGVEYSTELTFTVTE